MKSATPLAALWCMAMVAAKYIGLWGQISSCLFGSDARWPVTAGNLDTNSIRVETSSQRQCIETKLYIFTFNRFGHWIRISLPSHWKHVVNWQPKVPRNKAGLYLASHSTQESRTRRRKKNCDGRVYFSGGKSRRTLGALHTQPDLLPRRWLDWRYTIRQSTVWSESLPAPSTWRKCQNTVVRWRSGRILHCQRQRLVFGACILQAERSIWVTLLSWSVVDNTRTLLPPNNIAELGWLRGLDAGPAPLFVNWAKSPIELIVHDQSHWKFLWHALRFGEIDTKDGADTTTNWVSVNLNSIFRFTDRRQCLSKVCNANARHHLCQEMCPAEGPRNADVRRLHFNSLERRHWNQQANISGFAQR